MKFLENDLEKIIYDTHIEDQNILRERGLNLYGKIFRQFKIPGYGVADLVTAYRDVKYSNDYLINKDNTYEVVEKPFSFISIEVIEIKKEKIGISSFLQAARYARGIQRFFELNKPSIRIEINIRLIGKGIDDSGSFCFLSDLIDNLTCTTYDYAFDGLQFKNEYDYISTKENLIK